MWRKIVGRYRGWGDEQLAVLEQAEPAARAPAAHARPAQTLAPLPAIQCRQLSEFLWKYRGWRQAGIIAGLIAVFSLCGAGLHAVSTGMSWTVALVCANAIGFALLVAGLGAWFDYRRLAQKKTKVMLSTLGAVVLTALGVTGSALWSGQSLAALLNRLSGMLSGMTVGILAVIVPMMAISILRKRHYEALNLRLQQEAEQERMARELSETRLRLLRAQIEPHFLFNTLGAVQQLAQHGAPRAAVLTANLITFLRSSMSDMRSEQVSLATEFGLVESYLKVMQVRQGERLRYTLALPPALEQVKVPSMILLTLAENAIKHGIEPALRGGEVALSARLEDGMVRLRVADSGVGMNPLNQLEPGAGTGLENVRHRLKLAYGDAAGLTLAEADPGLIADITMPYSAP